MKPIQASKPDVSPGSSIPASILFYSGLPSRSLYLQERPLAPPGGTAIPLRFSEWAAWRPPNGADRAPPMRMEALPRSCCCTGSQKMHTLILPCHSSYTKPEPPAIAGVPSPVPRLYGLTLARYRCRCFPRLPGPPLLSSLPPSGEGGTMQNAKITHAGWSIFFKSFLALTFHMVQRKLNNVTYGGDVIR